eukprot:Nitzschia sp. Nitz4//scaffold73_size107353//105926//107220//NITZ4_004335-RA/size107353-snap-gene-0.97-mRNA-1//1//CDS//3329557521//543//frame0
MAGWTDRAKELRENRRKNIPGLGSGGDTEVDVGFIPLVIVVLILLAIGAGAHVVADGTAAANSVGLLRSGGSELAVQKPDPKPIVVDSFVAQQKPAEPAVSSSGIPMCTEEQSKAVRAQLSVDNCYQPPYLQGCSFCKATAKVCRDSTAYMRKIYAEATLPAGSSQVFTAISTGFHAEETSAQDMVYVFGHGAQKRVPPEKCPLPEVSFGSATPNEAFEVYVVDGNENAGKYVEGLKSQFSGIKDTQLVHDTSSFTRESTLAKWVESKLTVEKNPVIHYLRMYQAQPELIMGAKPIWNRILYMELHYDSKGTWDQQPLKAVVDALEHEGGFACYWQGDGLLWRITGCWQHYYSALHWSFFTCVNTKHTEAAALYTQMEQTFKDTLAKTDLKF